LHLVIHFLRQSIHSPHLTKLKVYYRTAVLKIASHLSLLGYRSTKPISSHSISVRYILILSPHLGLYLLRVSSLQVFTQKLSMYFSSLHCLTLYTLKLNPICYLLALLEAHHFLHVSRIRVKSLILRLLMSYIYGAPILDVSRSHTTTHHSW